MQISELELTVRDPSTLPSNATHTEQQNCHELAGNSSCNNLTEAIFPGTSIQLNFRNNG